MSRDRSFDALTDEERRVLAAAEPELTRLLAVDPGPAFAAKVRARIQDAAPPSPWPRWVPVGLGLVMAAIALAVVATTIRQAPDVTVAPASNAPAPRDLRLAADARKPIEPAARAPEPERVRKTASRRRVVLPPEQPVVDTSQHAAVDRLLAIVRSGDVDFTGAERPTAAVSRDLDVVPVVVEDIHVPQIGIGGTTEDPDPVRR
jgi:hypothetical protein